MARLIPLLALLTAGCGAAQATLQPRSSSDLYEEAIDEGIACLTWGAQTDNWPVEVEACVPEDGTAVEAGCALEDDGITIQVHSQVTWRDGEGDPPCRPIVVPCGVVPARTGTVALRHGEVSARVEVVEPDDAGVLCTGDDAP